MRDFRECLLNDTIDHRNNFHAMVYFETLLKCLPVRCCSRPMSFGNLVKKVRKIFVLV